jgi:hypothetical protein
MSGNCDVGDVPSNSSYPWSTDTLDSQKQKLLNFVTNAAIRTFNLSCSIFLQLLHYK